MLRTGVRNNSATVDAMLRRHAQVVGCNHHLLLRYPPGQSCQHPQLSQLSRPASSVHHKLSQQFGVQRQLRRLLSGFAIGGGSLRKGSGGHGVEGRGLTVGVMSGDSGKQPEPESATGHKHTNRLVKEQSPYLLQHAHNPVDWYPWGEEAFAKARAEDKPIFLSVGYSTCHWCHVMEVESFESDEVAKLMNDWFVSIKVDREERPDVDKVYMTYVQATQGGGGWPMSVFLTPELKPIVGGTYFPPDDKYGRPGFKTALKRVKEVWDANKDSIRETGDQVIQQLSDATTARASSTELGEGSAVQAVQLCAQQLAKGYDPKLGGFGGPPKFPRPVELNVILRRFRQLDQSGKESAAAKVLEMALFTMRSMANGGIHDHLGGGFHRYSVDEYWHVPHFEKMLYDQGQLVNVFLDAFAITKDVQYASFARDILDYIRRDMTDPEGGIYSAEDADSAETQGATRKREGAFYVWTRQEIGAILGEDRAKIFSTHYYVKPGGNCDLSRMSDPHKEFVGKNALIQRQSLSDTAAKCGKSTDEVTEILASCRRELHSVRNARPRPLLDDKVIVAWNGLVISALARASRILKVEPENAKFYFPVMGREPNVYLASAEKAAAYLKKKLYDEKTHRLKRSFRVEPSDAPGFLEDYAFLISALLDLYEAGGNTSWLAWALDLQEKQDEFFLDASGGGYFSTPEGDSSILFRVKDDYDGAEPSGNSVAAINLLRLSALVGGEKANYFRRTAEHLLAVFEGRIKEVALAIPLMCCAFDTFHTASKRQIIVSGGKDATDTQKLVSVCHSFYDPDRTILQIDPNDPQDVAFWGKHNPAALAVVQSGRKERATAYVCQNFTCRAPTSEPEILERSLRQANVPPEMTTFKIGTTSLSK